MDQAPGHFVATVAGDRGDPGKVPMSRSNRAIPDPTFVVGLALLMTTTACLDTRSSDAASCQRSGPRTGGPGDVANYFPIATGNSWTYEVTPASPALTARSQIEITGPQPLHGAPAQVFTG